MIARSPIKRRTAIKRRTPRKRIGAEPKYLAWLRTQPCAVCAHRQLHQTSITEAAHVGLRGLGCKCPDAQAIPLCAAHHRTGKDAHHVAGKAFWALHGLVKEVVIERLRKKYLEA